MATAPAFDEETEKKILRQVEFYFSDSNLPRDNFLRKSISKTEDGMVSLALICSFSRMKIHLGLGDAKLEDISEDTAKAVAVILRNSSLLKVSEDGKKVGRTTELLKPEEVIEQVDIRTVSVSPLEYDVKLEEVESFFVQYGKVNSVRLPRHISDKKFFCGTALVEFATEEDAENVLKQSLAYAGAELEIKTKKDFDAERAKMAGRIENSGSYAGSKGKSSSGTNENYPKGLIVTFKLKSMSTEESAEQNGLHKPTDNSEGVCKTGKGLNCTENAPQVLEEACEERSVDNIESESKEKVDEKISEENEKMDTEDTVPKSDENSPQEASQESEEKTTVGEKTIAAIYNDDKSVVLREDLKNAFKKFGTVKFVDYRIGEDSGYIRFEEPEAAQKACAAAVLVDEGGLIVKNYVASLEAVTGEAEREYWSVLRGDQERFRERGGNRGRGGRNNRGRRQSNGKDTRSREKDSSGGRQSNSKRTRSREKDSSVERPNKSRRVAVA